MSTPPLLLYTSLLLLLLGSHPTFSSATPLETSDHLDLDEDLKFLLDQESTSPTTTQNLPPPRPCPSDDDEEEEGYEDDFDNGGGFFDEPHSGHRDPSPPPAIDDGDVVVLTERNFSDVIDDVKYAMVEFYAPWCEHCRALAPEYAAAAAELRGEAVVLAKVDATKERGLARDHDVRGFPTVVFFVDGEHRPYPGQRKMDAIVTWIKKKIGPAVHNITSTEDAKRILTSNSKLVLAFLESLAGPENQELAAASRREDDVSFFLTTNPDVAKLFHIDPTSNRPALVMLKKEAEKISHFGGQFTKSEIANFVVVNKIPLVTTFNKENAPLIFENPIKKQLLLFTTRNGAETFLPVFEESAKLFKGKIVFVCVEVDNEDGKPVADFFGVAGYSPKVLAYLANDKPKKYFLDGEVTLNSVKAFAEAFLEDNLKPFYKSEPVPKNIDGDVKVVVGDNFDEIVLDESKDVLLEIYAPWCGHCQALEPIYNKLAKYLHGIESLVIAKMDGTTNEHPRAKADGFPTLLFYPAGNKSSDPLTVDSDQTVVEFYKFLKRHASIPFKLSRPLAPMKSESKSGKNVEVDFTKDEL